MEFSEFGRETVIFGTEPLLQRGKLAKMPEEVNKMHDKIVVISSNYLCQPTREALKRVEPDCDYIVVPYENFDSITAVYERYAQDADGFLISGQSALDAIRLGVRKELKPMVPFQVDTAALYKALLSLVLKNRQQDLGRVIMDALLLVEDGYTAADFLERSEVDSLDSQIKAWIRQISQHGLGGVEKAIKDRIFTLWDEGKIDMVICQYSSIIPALEERGIPYRYPFLSDYELSETVKALLVKIELEKLRANLPAMICVAPRHALQVAEEQREKLHAALVVFFREHLMPGAVKEEQNVFCAALTVQNVRHFTRNSTSCMIGAYLGERLDFEVAVGYGIGSSFDHAMNNARAALKESALIGRGFIKDESGNFIGPLDAQTPLVVRTQPVRDVGAIAKQCGLSTLTIQKVLSSIRVSGTNKTTTQELAARFGVTVRNANRILSGLEKGGYAKIIYSQTSSSKGRPVKVYELDFEQE